MRVDFLVFQRYCHARIEITFPVFCRLQSRGSPTDFMSVFKSLKTLGSKAKSKTKSINEDSLRAQQILSSQHDLDDLPFWMERIKHQGKAPFHPDPQYKVFRNVKVRSPFEL